MMNFKQKSLTRPIILAILLTLLIGYGATTLADVRLPSVISDNMVIQRGSDVKIWGWAEPGENITVSLSGQGVVWGFIADEDGKWEVTLKEPKPGGPYELIVEGDNRINVKNIIVGDVWFCSGQSNMEWSVTRANNPKHEIATSHYPNIRLFSVTRDPSGQPMNDCEGSWSQCSPETVAGFSAVGYFFGRKLHTELNIPIGLINSSWGGTRVEPWTPPVGFESVPALGEIREQIKQADKDFRKILDDYLDMEFIDQWARLSRKALKSDGPLPPPPAFPKHPLDSHRLPAGLYNGMVHPIAHFAIKGAIWYQGESNRGERMMYYEKKKALINGWRKIWGRGDFPFYFVQLAPFRYGGDPVELPMIWEAQTATLAVPNTGMAVTTDIGNLTDIHPKNKQEVGRRLALWALAKDYGRADLVYSGPLYKSMAVEDNKIRISFDHIGSGLASGDGKPLSWFTISGVDPNFVEAQAKIEGDTVVVWSDQIAKPAAVRFGWNQEAEPNLTNKDGLPASPFRTDDWLVPKVKK
jgi:sialate O-acetylesterase